MSIFEITSLAITNCLAVRLCDANWTRDTRSSYALWLLIRTNGWQVYHNDKETIIS